MADFKIAYALTAAMEGLYANDPADAGGETWKGIARNKNPHWVGFMIIDNYRCVKNFPKILEQLSELEEVVATFYKENYWNAQDLDEVNNQPIANKLYDMGVNCGIGFSGKALQRCLNLANKNGKLYADLKVDGNVGPKTIQALNRHPQPAVIHRCLNILQGMHYIELCENNQSQEVFFNGWIANRIAVF